MKFKRKISVLMLLSLALVIGTSFFFVGLSWGAPSNNNVIFNNNSNFQPSSDDDLDGIDDEIEENEERDVNVDISGDEVKIESREKNQDPADEISFSIKPESDGLKINMQYSGETGSTEVQLEVSIIFEEIIEFVDNNTNGYYDENDDILNQTMLDNFQQPNYSSSLIDSNNLLHYIKYQSADNIFIAHIYVAEEYVNMNGTILQPMQMKIDVEIQNYTYAGNSSQLALSTKFESGLEYESEDETEDERDGYNHNEAGVKASAGEYTGYFSWTQEAMVDGIAKNVSVSPLVLHEEDGSRVYITYPRGDHIFHDPKLGIEIFIKAFNYLALTIIIAILAVIVLFGLVMSKEEYRSYLLNRVVSIKRGPHKLTMEEVLDNVNRNNILDMIIDEPGIHYKELLRRSDISPSNLAWHLDILETYKIVHKARVGQFLVYYPYLDKNPFVNFDPRVAKSKTTLEINQLVGDHPGMMQSQISRRMELDHKTVKYHLEKLMDADLIISEKEGRRNKYYPTTGYTD